jgi:hypothetical protein
MDFSGAQDTILWYKIASEGCLLVKFKISNNINFKQNIDETHSKHPKIYRKIHTSLWILKISRKKSSNQKSQNFYQIILISKKKTIP